MKILAAVLLIFLSANYSNGQGCLSSSYGGGNSGYRQLDNSSGNNSIDMLVLSETNYLRSAFAVNCAVYFYQDPSSSPNAEASPDISINYMPDGTVVLGYNMIRKQLSINKWGSTIPYILAHEFGHILCFKMGWEFSAGQSTVKLDELFADFCAGAYLHDRSMYLPSDATSTIYAFFNLGDYEFNDDQHHGTPGERVAAVKAGFSCMRNFRLRYPGQVFSLNNLYSSYLDFIN